MQWGEMFVWSLGLNNLLLLLLLLFLLLLLLLLSLLFTAIVLSLDVSSPYTSNK
jgi:hypothetical protein